ncbi:MAG: fibronectin type III domain-containing protein [Desulfobacteraceae bacterium]|jgi:hypothetical protein
MFSAASSLSNSKLFSLISYIAGIRSRISISHPLKSALYAVTLIVFYHTSGFAYQITLEWDSNVEQDLGGYIVYYGTASRDYDYDIDIGDETSCTISGLYSGVTYYFAVTAYDLEGNESDYSAEITYPNTVYAGSGGGGGGCFISAAADGKNSIYYLLGSTGGFIGFLLAGVATNGLKSRRCIKPVKNLP